MPNKQEIFIKKEVDKNGLAICLKPNIPYVITPSLIHKIRKIQNQIVNNYQAKPWNNVLYVIWYLHSGKIALWGLDFNYIYQNIKTGKNGIVEKYLEEISDVMCLNYIGLGLPVVNCSFIHRELNGCAKEFFFMNQVNFIRSDLIEHGSSKHHEVKLLESLHQDPSLNFPKKIYDSNSYFSYKKINTQMIKEILQDFNYNPKTKKEISRSH